MMQNIDDHILDTALDYPSLIEAIRSAFIAGGSVPARMSCDIGSTESGPGTLLVMPSWRTDELLGVKVATIYPENPTRGLPTLMATYFLLDARTGKPLAIMNGRMLTLRRTAATSALASNFLSRTDADILLMVGAGALAAPLVQAHAVVRQFRSVLIWNRTPDRARSLATTLQSRGYPARTTSDLEAACGSADIISCATTSRLPLLRGSWIGPGTHIDLVGAFRPDMRESDDQLIQESSVFVDSREAALIEAGDLVFPIRSGRWSGDDIRADLAELSLGAHPGRRDDSEVTVFKSVGHAIEDLAAATLVWKRVMS